jgi:hypothetical protein
VDNRGLAHRNALSSHHRSLEDAACPKGARRADLPEDVPGIGAVDKDDSAPLGACESRGHLEDEDGVLVTLRIERKHEFRKRNAILEYPRVTDKQLSNN